MKSEVKEQWVAALRSGKYKQTRKRLRDSDGYCCLGVLCDLAAKAGVGRWEEAGNLYETPFLGEYETPPAPVVEWAALPSANPKVAEVLNGHLDTLAELNDHGYTFTQIADVIERDL